MSRRSKGFTLIELLIVVAIIGILAAIAIPKFANTKKKAIVASMKSDLRNLVTAEEAYAVFSPGRPSIFSETYHELPPVAGHEALLARWAHFLAGVIWIGHNYSSVVQRPSWRRPYQRWSRPWARPAP